MKKTGLEGYSERAWKTARIAAHMLRNRFGANRVVVFGSLVRDREFTQWSDIDMAAWGISPRDFYRAVADITGFSYEFDINLIDTDVCSPVLMKSVETEGVEV